MGKIARRYKFLIGLMVITLSVAVMINLVLRIKIDRIKLSSINDIKYEEEFRQSRENAFVNFKDSLMERNIIIDNIQYLDNGKVRFDINQVMYINYISDFLRFLNSTPNLKIDDMHITKSNFDYNLIISAEI